MIKVFEIMWIYNEAKTDIIDKKRLHSATTNICEFLGQYLINEIDVPKCQDYSKLRKQYGKNFRNKEISDSTIARELGVLKAAANHALKHKKITLDEMPTFEIPKNLPKREIWLHHDEIRLLYMETIKDPEMYLFVRLLYATGSRRAAIEQLEWSQVDFKQKTIKLNKPGQKETKKKRPIVPIGGLYELLEEAYEKKKNKYVLGSAKNRYRNFIKLLKDCNLLEVDEIDGRPAGRISPHVIRHSRATHLLQAGMTPYNVGKLLGDTASTIEKIYGHACMNDLSEQLDKYGE